MADGGDVAPGVGAEEVVKGGAEAAMGAVGGFAAEDEVVGTGEEFFDEVEKGGAVEVGDGGADVLVEAGPEDVRDVEGFGENLGGLDGFALVAGEDEAGRVGGDAGSKGGGAFFPFGGEGPALGVDTLERQ